VRKWIEPREILVPEELSSTVGGHPLVAETLMRRGLGDIEAARSFLDPQWYEPAPASDLPHLVSAVERLERAIERGEEVCVWGDFDVDGQTATTVLFATLQDLGASVRYHIPVRASESHGVNLPVLQQLIADGVQLVITCDTGITAHDAVTYANGAGVDVVITDHHDLPDVLPDACAVVNPKMVPDSHPLRELPGVGCAYKVAEALYERTGRPRDVEQYLDLVALGIVADVAVQRKDVRYLLQRGLEALRRTERLGLQALMELANVNPEWLTEEHIGFYLAPRLNAVGRLADASVAVELLTTEDLSRARVLATELEGLNARRRLLSDQVFEAAVEQVERDPSLLERGALVLSHRSWPAGVIGIVASRLVERYGLPTVLLATPPGELARGSARSIAGCNITAAISAQADLLAAFGGHPMAAGLAMNPERLTDFARGLSSTVSEMLRGVDDGTGLAVAGYVSLSEVSLELVEQLERLAPFGPGNPAPTLATKDLALAGKSTVGRKGEHLQIIVEDADGVQARLIWWQGTSWSLPEGRFDLAYTVRASDYRGQRELQIEWVDARPLERAVVELVAARAAPSIIDCRGEAEPRRWLDLLRARGDVAVWTEAAARSEIGGADRRELGPSEGLVIWTVPPGWRELQQVLKQVSPQKVYVLGMDPGMDDPQQFLQRLAGLVKKALATSQGRVSLARLATATAQREAAVSLGLDWLVEHGHVSIVEDEGEEIVLAPGSGVPGADVKGAAARLRSLLQETAAYRRHFSGADAETLLAH
jgi:single-stranded-DNA-specific exonuclease